MKQALSLVFASFAFCQWAGAQTPAIPSGGSSEEAQLAQKWEAERGKLEGVPPVERIAQVDQWLVREKDSIVALEQSRRQQAAAAQNAVVPKPALPDSVTGPMRDVLQIDLELADAVRSLDEAKMSPEQRIQWIDSFLEMNKEALADRDRLLKTAAQASSESQTNGPAALNGEAAEIRKIIDSANKLSPEERIAAIDAAGAELRQREAQLQQSLKKEDKQN